MLKAFSIRFSLDFLSRIFIFAINIIIARKLSVSDYGTFTYLLSLANLLYVFTEMGVNTYLLKEVGKDVSTIQTMWPTAVCLKLILSVCIVIISSFVVPFSSNYTMLLLYYFSLGWMIGNSFADFYQTFCNALHDFKLAAKLTFYSRFLLIAGIAVFLILNKMTLFNIMIVFFFGSLSGALIGGLFFKKVFKIPFVLPTRKSISALFMHAIPIGFANIFGMIYLRMDSIFLNWLKGSAETGIYGAAYRLFEVFYTMTAALMIIATPLLAKAKESGFANLKNVMKRTVQLSVTIASVLFLVVFFGSEKIISILFGTRYLDAAGVLRVLILANIVAFFTHLVNYLMIIMDRQKRHAFNQALTLVLSIFINLLFISTWGKTGAALSVLTIHVTILMLGIVSLYKPFKTYAYRH